MDYNFHFYGVDWVLPYRVRDLLIPKEPYEKKFRKFWVAVTLCLFWTVWKERNKIIFNIGLFSLYMLKKNNL